MKLQEFLIVLDQNKSVFVPGDVLSGQVVITLQKPVELRVFEIGLKGLAKVHWTEQHSSGSSKHHTTHTVTYSANESYIDVKIQLLGVSDASLAAGQHQFPFTFQLPNTVLPTSFEGDHGWVRYYLEAVLDESRWKYNKRCKVGFTMICHVDCNVYPHLLNPLKSNETKEVCCLCCASHMNAELEIQRQAYCPGESIIHSGFINNETSRDVIPFIELYQKILFKATSKTRTVNKLVCKVSGSEMTGNSQHSWTQKTLLIPPIPPTLTNCGIIEATYFVRLHVDIPLAVDCRLDLPLLIGTIPVYAGQSYGANYNTQYGVVTEQPSLPAAEPHPSIAPPSYASCVFGAVDLKEDDGADESFMGDTGFVPMYTYYGQPQI